MGADEGSVVMGKIKGWLWAPLASSRTFSSSTAGHLAGAPWSELGLGLPLYWVGEIRGASTGLSLIGTVRGVEGGAGLVLGVLPGC